MITLAIWAAVIAAMGIASLWIVGALSFCWGISARNGAELYGVLWNGHVFVGVVVSEE